MSCPLLNDIAPGQPLFGIVKHMSQTKIDKFASVTGGVGAIHLDPEYCKNTRFKSTLAHGYMTIAYAVEMLRNR